jgi:hypothetical protein
VIFNIESTTAERTLALTLMPEKTDLIDPDCEVSEPKVKMDIKVLQKSNTFSSLSTGSQKLGSWFDRRARKLSMKCSKSITLGECPVVVLAVSKLK